MTALRDALERLAGAVERVAHVQRWADEWDGWESAQNLPPHVATLWIALRDARSLLASHPVSDPLYNPHSLSCGHTMTPRATACPTCLVQLRTALREIRASTSDAEGMRAIARAALSVDAKVSDPAPEARKAEPGGHRDCPTCAHEADPLCLGVQGPLSLTTDADGGCTKWVPRTGGGLTP